MKRITNIIAGLSISFIAFAAVAAPSYRHVREEAILTNIMVEPTNGGINPDARAYVVRGQVMLGSNSCFAQGLQGKLKIEKAPLGNRHIVAYVEGRQRSDLVCIEIYMPVYADVSITVRGGSKLTETVFVRNVEDFGTLRPLSSFMDESNAGNDNRCDRPVICTREYRPTICSVNGVDIRGNNPCEAMANVKRYACLNGMTFQSEDVICRAASIPE